MTPNPNETTGRKYGEIAGSRHINDFIYLCFDYISQEDQRVFVKKFRKQPHDSDQIMHTFRELVLGAYLSSNGFKVRHDYAVEAKTPDWCILDDMSEINGIIELTNFHLDRATETEIQRRAETNPIVVFSRDQNKDNVERLYQCIWHKADAYNSLIEKLRIPYVVSIFGEVEVSIDFEEVRHCLFGKDIGLFERYPDLSGVLYFQEKSGRYFFDYAKNPHALRILDIPNGSFPTEMP